MSIEKLFGCAIFVTHCVPTHDISPLVKDISGVQWGKGNHEMLESNEMYDGSNAEGWLAVVKKKQVRPGSPLSRSSQTALHACWLQTDVA